MTFQTCCVDLYYKYVLKCHKSFIVRPQKIAREEKRGCYENVEMGETGERKKENKKK